MATRYSDLIILLSGGINQRRMYFDDHPKVKAVCHDCDLALLKVDDPSFMRGIEPAEVARRLSRLLRRYALTRFPRREVAGLAGDDWLRFLDAHGGDNSFTQGSGRVLQDIPYRPGADTTTLAELAALVRNWIVHNAKEKT